MFSFILAGSLRHLCKFKFKMDKDDIIFVELGADKRGLMRLVSRGQCEQWRSQSSGDGSKISQKGPPGRVGPLPKNENQTFFAHFNFEGPFSDLDWALLCVGWAP